MTATVHPLSTAREPSLAPLVALTAADMNGAEVAREVSLLPNPPSVLVITGYADSEALKEIGEGIVILRKPFEAEMLLDAVTRVLNS